MNEMKKYIEAMEAAVEAKNKKSIELLEGLSAYVYQFVFAKAQETSGTEHAEWEALHQRAKDLISSMAKTGHSIWL
jgi:phosphoserine phosphatase